MLDVEEVWPQNAPIKKRGQANYWLPSHLIHALRRCET